MLALAKAAIRRLTWKPAPRRMLQEKRVRLVAALVAGLVATVVFFATYYLSLGMLPRTYVTLGDFHPTSLWAERLDIAQFFGVLLDPPYPTIVTWWLGLGALASLLLASAVIYAVLLSWGLAGSSAKRGAVFGTLLFFVIASAISLGSGYNPAVMRGALPDVGFFYLGWTGWATLQLLICFMAYGAVGGAVYGYFSGHEKT